MERGTDVVDQLGADDLAPALSDLAGLLVDDGDLSDSMRRVADLAVALIPGCDLASVTLLRGLGAETVASTDPDADAIDAAQYASDEGPCLEAAREGHLVLAEDDEAWARWPELAAEASRRGVLSFLAAPFVVREESIGALNLFSRAGGSFGTLDAVLLDAYRRQAAVALSNARVYDQAVRLSGQLGAALESRATIEQAKGVLMCLRRIDADAAFTLLREQSQAENTKLRDVAERVVRELAL